MSYEIIGYNLMKSDGKLIVEQNVISINRLCVCVNVITHMLVSPHALVELYKDILIWLFMEI